MVLPSGIAMGRGRLAVGRRLAVTSGAAVAVWARASEAASAIAPIALSRVLKVFIFFSPELNAVFIDAGRQTEIGQSHHQ